MAGLAKLETLTALGSACILASTLAACGTTTPSGGGSDEGSAADGTGAPSTTGDAKTPPAPTSSTGAGAEQGGDSAPDTGNAPDDGEDVDPPVVFDFHGIPDAPDIDCSAGGGNGDGELELAYIWIANSQQGTISKIDTDTMTELGRYYAKEANGDPSRTTVNLNGDVAVANRNGGIAKFWANPDNCFDANGNGSIQTSIGSADILPWAFEECRAWFTPLACSTNRPVAWTRGEIDPETCQYDAKLWTACDANVHLINGETGDIEETIPTSTGFIYGGAADAESNFWGLDTSQQQIFRVDAITFDVQYWPLGPGGGYGIAVDYLGRPWTCGGGGVRRFNLAAETWDSVGPNNGIGGCMTDDTTIWHSNGNVLTGYDLETLAVSQTIPLPVYVHGVSIDFLGKVWGVSFAGSTAYRADPNTGVVDTFNGLVGAYTYSDMTGFALQNAGAGGVPQG